MNMWRPALFLDRDGVINYNRADYVRNWSEFEFLPGVLNALPLLSKLDWLIIVVTNQSAIGRGLVEEEEVRQIHQRMLDRVKSAGGLIHHVFYCPHHPAENCDCRKPKPGLLLHAKEHLHIDLARSVLIGDALTDLDAARSVGCLPILVKTGRGLDQLSLLPEEKQQEILVVDDLAAGIAQVLLWQERKQASDPHCEGASASHIHSLSSGLGSGNKRKVET
jgi:D-glycero-D-manno-heptose 1,7-bisphosphate phosphatase